MKEETTEFIKTIHSDDLKEFDKLYNSTARKLKGCIRDTKDLDSLTTRFYCTIKGQEPETFEDDFMQHHVGCTCSDCPFLEVGTDARRRWFPCEYAPAGETRIDCPACDQFYREAVRMMRERAKI